MPYVGRSTDKISNIEVLDNITFDGSSSYSITKGSVAFTPNSAQSLLISIDGVVQATNFSVNSSTIDFGVAIPSTSTCNFFLHYGTGVMTVPSDGSVTTAKLGSNAVTSAKMFSGFANGITMADQWRLSADTNQGTVADITTNWERVDTNGYGSIGTGLTESSGIFSFPQTGVYFMNCIWQWVNRSGDATQEVKTWVTTDNSTYVETAKSLSGNTGSSDINMTTPSQFIINVTDITTHKFKFATNTISGSSKLGGDTSKNETCFTAIRLGDSV